MIHADRPEVILGEDIDNGKDLRILNAFGGDNQSFGGKVGSLMKVKLFWKNAPVVHGDKNARAFEDEINAWLSEHPRITIIDIRQSSSGETFGSWFVSVWYEDGGAEQAAAPDRGGR